MANPKFDKLQINGIFLGNSSSGKAFHMAICDHDGEELKRQWFPHSQVTMHEDLGGGRVNGVYKESIAVAVPKWLVENENLDEYVFNPTAEGLDGEEADSREEQLDKEYGQDYPGWRKGDLDDDIPF